MRLNSEGAAVAEPSSKGRATVLACPKCATVLFENGDGGAPQLLCAHGHGYAPEELIPGIAEDLQGLLPELVEALAD